MLLALVSSFLPFYPVGGTFESPFVEHRKPDVGRRRVVNGEGLGPQFANI